MKTQHIAFLTIVVVAALAAVPFLWTLRRGPAPESEDDFLREIRDQREHGVGSNSAAGTVSKTVGQIHIESDVLDLGTVPNDRHTKAEFRVLNQGDGPLQIVHLESSCGKCTKVSLPDDGWVVPPGGETTIDVKFMPEGVPGFRSEKTMLIQSNDPVNTILKVLITADIDPEFIVEPAEVDFGEIEKGVPLERKIRVRPNDETPFRIKEVTTPGDRNACSVDWTQLPESEWRKTGRPEYELTVRPLPDVKPGKFLDRVRISSTCKRVPEMDIRISGDVHAFYTVEPEMLALRKATKPGTKDAATAIIRAEEPFEIKDVSVDTKDLRAEARRGDEPNTVLLALSVPEDVSAGFKKGVLSFEVVAGQKKARHTMRVFATVKE